MKANITIPVDSAVLEKARQLGIPVQDLLRNEILAAADKVLLPLIGEYAANCDRTDYVPSWVKRRSH